MTESERQKASSEYYSELKKQLDELLKKDAELLKISEKIRNNKANFNDTAKYSEIVSNYIAKVLQENVGNISSPMGKEYVCKELLNAHYSTINDVLGKVQVSVDNQNNIHIRPQQAPFPAERVEQVAHSLEDATVPEEVIKRRSGSSVANVAKSFHDDFIKENADFRSKSGLKCYITRHSSGNCCKWCSSIAGKYSYKDAPHDVFRRHDNCNCTVTYENGRQRQNVWTKESWQVKGILKEKFQPVKLNRERAKAVQQENLQYKGFKNELTSSQNSGKINLNDNNSIYKPISQQAIDNIPNINIFNDVNLNKLYRIACQDLLKEVKKHLECPVGTEFSIVYDENMKYIDNYSYRIGTIGNVKLSNPHIPFHAFHNHGSGETFSYTDLICLVNTTNMLSLTAVGNNGNIFNILKSSNRNDLGYRAFLRQQSSEIFFSANNVDFTLDLLTSLSRFEEAKSAIGKLSVSQIEELKKSLIIQTEKCIMGGEPYGFIYKKRTT